MTYFLNNKERERRKEKGERRDQRKGKTEKGMNRMNEAIFLMTA